MSLSLSAFSKSSAYENTYFAFIQRRDGRAPLMLHVQRREPGCWFFSVGNAESYESYRTVHAAKRVAGEWVAAYGDRIQKGSFTERAYIAGEIRKYLYATGTPIVAVDYAHAVMKMRRARLAIMEARSFTDAEYAEAASLNAARDTVQPFGRSESEYYLAHYLNAHYRNIRHNLAQERHTQDMVAVYGVPPLALLRQLASPATAEDGNEHGSTCGARQVGSCTGKRAQHKAFPSTFTTPESYMDMKAAAQHRLHQKVGGIHFLRIGRLRMSFCVARAPVKDEPFWERQPSDYGRLALAVMAIGAVLLSSHGIASDWAY